MFSQQMKHAVLYKIPSKCLVLVDTSTSTNGYIHGSNNDRPRESGQGLFMPVGNDIRGIQSEEIYTVV